MRFARSIIFVGSLLVWTTASADPRTVNDAVYSKAQAKVGEKLYADNCLLCHDKKYFRPVLKRWEGQSLSILFTVMSTTMPESNPGSLTDHESVDVIAYMLTVGGIPPGDDELRPDSQSLALAVIQQQP